DRSPRANYLSAAGWFAKWSLILVPLSGGIGFFFFPRGYSDPSMFQLLVFIAVAYLAIMSVAGAFYCSMRAVFASNQVTPETFDPQAAA
ncbi:MAG TPA: hypothetical protein VMM77_12505, partial [Gemmatimonadaceae bacterium]|nr:hypothetical protein [Gemmatimonadaceae bacterium]